MKVPEPQNFSGSGGKFPIKGDTPDPEESLDSKEPYNRVWFS